MAHDFTSCLSGASVRKFTRLLQLQAVKAESAAKHDGALPAFSPSAAALASLAGAASALASRLADDARAIYSADVRAEALRLLEAQQSAASGVPARPFSEADLASLKTAILRDVSVAAL